MSNIAPEIKELSAKMQSMMKVDNKTGQTDVQEDIWEKTLPDNLSKEQIKQVKEHETNFIAAGADAIGHLAIAAMNKNSSLEEVQATVGMSGRDHVGYSVAREKTFTNPQDKDADPIVRHAVIGVNFRNMSGRNAGDLKKVIKAVQEQAEKDLKK